MTGLNQYSQLVDVACMLCYMLTWYFYFLLFFGYVKLYKFVQ